MSGASRRRTREAASEQPGGALPLAIEDQGFAYGKPWGGGQPIPHARFNAEIRRRRDAEAALKAAEHDRQRLAMILERFMTLAPQDERDRLIAAGIYRSADMAEVDFVSLLVAIGSGRPIA